MRPNTQSAPATNSTTAWHTGTGAEAIAKRAAVLKHHKLPTESATDPEKWRKALGPKYMQRIAEWEAKKMPDVPEQQEESWLEAWGRKARGLVKGTIIGSADEVMYGKDKD